MQQCASLPKTKRGFNLALITLRDRKEKLQAKKANTIGLNNVGILKSLESMCGMSSPFIR